MPAMNLRLDQQSVSLSAQRTTPISHRPLAPGVHHAVALPASSALPITAHGSGGGVRRSKPACRSRQQVIVSAVSTSAPTKTFQQEYSLPDGKKLKAAVETRDDGSQQITFRTDLPAGRLLLHWGVQGGGSGWHLPRSRPEHTSQYKDRALQSPFNNNELRVNLPADEASSAINFVLKDAGSNRWYDCNGSNFVLQLRGGSGNKAVEGITVAGGGQAPAAAVTQLPDELCGKWAYIKWEANGRKNSSWAESQADYEKGVLEMRLALTAGKSMDDLWRVVNGQWQYRDFMNQVQQANSQQSQQQAPPPPQQQQQQQAQPQQAAQQQQQPKAQQQPSTPTEVGKSLDGVQQRNPLDMIKKASGAPNLSDAKNEPEPEKPLAFLVQKMAVDSATKWRRTYAMGGKSELLVAVRQEQEGGDVQILMVSDLAADQVLHWGVSPPGSRDQFQLPAEGIWPEDGNSEQAGSGAVDTSFVKATNEVCGVPIVDAKVPLQSITIKLPADHDVGGITFVIRSKDNTMWYKDGGKNFFVPVPGKHAALKKEEDPLGGIKDNLSRDIVEAENSSAWTLMHRFNRVADLISTVQSGAYNMPLEDAYSRLYVWLRYSSTRHLTWQRNYNTQPRILSGAQERLTNSIADAHSKTSGEAQEWLRLMLTTVGRGGGDGQKIRDEILNIMHRNNIKESAGHWMEYWHQKLHNNTTPDDVPICEAYIAFLRANGDKGAYWRVLSDAGITKQRLETYDRPIPVEPDFWGDKKDTLIGEFSNYLNILKSVHSGADLHTSMQRSGDQVPQSAKGFLAYVASHRTDSQVLPLMEAAVEARTELAPAARGKRELLYLDLALEDIVRAAAERGVGSAGFGAAALMRPLLQNLAITLGDNEEVCYCLKSWNELPSSIRYGGRPNSDEALLAVSVLDRIRRAISVVSDKVVARIGGVASAYGKAFKIESWAVDLFSEEVVRGGPAFAVSLVISAIEPTIRSAAKLGAWQVISPQPAYGKVVVVAGLAEVQDKVYDEPTVLIANQVTGEEEIPEGAVAVLTPDAPDVLSHVSVRARNMKVLFATCHDAAPLEEISKLAGQWLSFSTTASGDVKWSDVKPAEDASAAGAESNASGKKLKITIPKWSGKWVVPMDGYEDGVVGAKSKNLALLRKSLPGSVTLPASITLPFGCFEQALALPENKKIKRRLQRFVARIDGRKPALDLLSVANAVKSFMDNSIEEEDELTDTPASELLALCRELAEQVQIPPTVKQELAQAMETAGIPPPKDEDGWERAFKALRGVWASKYNDRAYYSLRKNGLNFDDVRMAVLVQRVVPAQYAFVIHTRNPSNNNENEIFAELVLGLGESLVSGMVAGSAMAFKAEKGALDKPEVLCFPSKSEGMFVPDSLIFRSDSNGEDLEGYAGAGLYESITVDESKLKRVDYMSDRIVKDVAFRNSILTKILTVGIDIEKALGVAQDIEGVVDQDGNVTVVQTRPQV